MSIPKTVLAPTVIAVSPTETTLLSLTLSTMRSAERLTVQLANLDATQTFAGVVYRRQSGMVAWADSSIPDFSSIGPLGSAMADLVVGGTEELEVRGTMSGAGGSVRVGATKKDATFA